MWGPGCPAPAALRMPRCQQCQDRVGLGTQQGDHPLLIGSLDSHLSTLAPLLPARYNLLSLLPEEESLTTRAPSAGWKTTWTTQVSSPHCQGELWAAVPHTPSPPAFTACTSLLQDNVAFVLCLDTVGRGDSLHLHVSKPPREGRCRRPSLRELETVGAPWGLGGGHGSCPCEPGASVGFPVGRWASPQGAPEAGGWGGTGDPSGGRDHLYRGR